MKDPTCESWEKAMAFNVRWRRLLPPGAVRDLARLLDEVAEQAEDKAWDAAGACADLAAEKADG